MPPLRPRLRRLWNRLLPDIRLPLRVSPGLWWIAENDAVSDMLFEGTFERDERALVDAFVKPGMTVLDVGAHAGLYTMIAAKRARPGGRVIAFEPSARERARLERHLRINGLADVTIEPIALGAVDGEVDLFVVETNQTGCNSLRRVPGEHAVAARVAIRRLDAYAADHGIDRVDFVKMDIEGGERDALLGGEALFRRTRPALLVEIEPARIAPWGYDPREIFELVASWGYEWEPGGGGNYLARPRTH
ncbi:MAG TPA: FkbM family methyltransferase [Vicinamibacterales bacterium]|nr:FkbM family methyltransferase [Vicinamibacterales bacterium]